MHGARTSSQTVQAPRPRSHVDRASQRIRHGVDHGRPGPVVWESHGRLHPGSQPGARRIVKREVSRGSMVGINAHGFVRSVHHRTAVRHSEAQACSVAKGRVAFSGTGLRPRPTPAPAPGRFPSRGGAFTAAPSGSVGVAASNGSGPPGATPAAGGGCPRRHGSAPDPLMTTPHCRPRGAPSCTAPILSRSDRSSIAGLSSPPAFQDTCRPPSSAAHGPRLYGSRPGTPRPPARSPRARCRASGPAARRCDRPRPQPPPRAPRSATSVDCSRR